MADGTLPQSLADGLAARRALGLGASDELPAAVAASAITASNVHATSWAATDLSIRGGHVLRAS